MIERSAFVTWQGGGTRNRTTGFAFNNRLLWGGEAGEGTEPLRAAEARAEAAELELERAHRLLDEHGVPREFRREGERDPIEYSLAGRLALFLEDDEEE